MSRKEVINAMFDHLKSVGIVKTQKELAEVIGAAETTISNALKDDTKKYATDTLLFRINDATGKLFNANWMLNGEGEMLCSSENIHIDNYTPISDKSFNRLIDEMSAQREESFDVIRHFQKQLDRMLTIIETKLDISTNYK